MNHVWHNAESTSHKTLIIHSGHVFVGSAADDQLAHINELLANDESPLRALGDKAVNINEQKLRRIESEAATTEITMRYTRDGQDRFTMVSVPDDDARDLALKSLEQVLGLERSTEQWSPIRAAKSPLIALGAITFFVFVLVNAAAELNTGQEVAITGRRRGLKRLLAFVLDVIGPTGVYIVGGVLGALVLYWLTRRIANPPKVTTLTPSA